MAVRGLAAVTPEREARARSLWKPMRGNLTEIRGGGTVPEAPRDVPSRSEADELLTEGTGATTPGREARAKSLRKPMPQGDWGGKRGDTARAESDPAQREHTRPPPPERREAPLFSLAEETGGPHRAERQRR